MKVKLEGKTREALVIASSMLVKHGLGDWHLELRNAGSYAAKVWHRKKVLAISERYIVVSKKDDFVNTLYHEIAHAIVGAKHGHDHVFKAKYYELSGNMTHAGYATEQNISLYQAYCTNCDNHGTINRRIKAWCGNCLRTLGVKNMLVIEDNKLIEVSWS